MKTFFAPPERSTDAELLTEINAVSNNPVIDGLLASVGGLIAVLNEHRQILSVNTALLRQLGLSEEVLQLGPRPGEIFSCVHAHDCESGCGTGEACASCGAVLAIMASLEHNSPDERICVLKTEMNGESQDLYLQIRTSPITFAGKRFILFFIQDRTDEQRAAAVERAFFHDINNSLTALLGMSELLHMEADPGAADLSDAVYRLSQRLYREVRIQQFLHNPGAHAWKLQPEIILLQELYDDFSGLLRTHPASAGRHLDIASGFGENESISTDRTLLMRILLNMLINAFEASSPADTIRFWHERTAGQIIFHVYNPQVIPRSIRARIFQRNFSTKGTLGRGIGTWSMKLLAEEYLHGQISFSSATGHGTTFSLSLPTT